MKYSKGSIGINKHKITHNLSKHPLYDIWKQMIRRCHNDSSEKYPMYGGRGIVVCASWHKVENFVAYIESNLGPKPATHSLDRIETNGNYEPGNVKWSTSTEQARNIRNNRMVTIDGVTKCAAQWAEDYNIPYWTFHGRLRRGITGVKLLATVRKLTKGR